MQSAPTNFWGTAHRDCGPGPWTKMTTNQNDEKLTQKLRGNLASLQLISRKTAAELMDVHPNHIDALIARGDLTAVHLGSRCKRIPMESIRKFLSHHVNG